MSIRSFNQSIPILGQRTYVDEAASVIGDVLLGDDVSIWPQAVLRGDVNAIRIGHRTNVQDGTVCHVTHKSSWCPEGRALIIGDDVTIGHRVVAHACAIGNLCLVGMGAVILDNAIIEDEVILGAGSLVTENKVLESGYLYVGAPAKKVRALTAEEKTFLKYSAAHYVKLKDQYLQSNLLG